MDWEKIKEKKSIIILFGIAILLVLFMFVSDKDGEKNATEIYNDIYAKDRYFYEYGVEKQKMNITKRQTNIDTKTDYVWVEISGSASDFSYSANYELEYVLYNDGWMLEKFNRTHSSYEVISSPDKKIAETAFLEQCKGQYEFIKVQKCTNDFYKYYYNEIDNVSMPYVSLNFDVTVDCSFSPSSGWFVSNIEKNRTDMTINQDNFLGIWHYQKQNPECCNNMECDYDIYISILNKSLLNQLILI